MANFNYTPSYKQYTQQSAGYVIPNSVKTYSVFDPSSNTWKRMTNNGMSPMPVQGQTPVADALALARQTQGRDWSVQPAPVQVPAQTPLGGSRTPSPASRGGTPSVYPPRGIPEAPAAPQGVSAGNARPARGMAVSGEDNPFPNQEAHMYKLLHNDVYW